MITRLEVDGFKSLRNFSVDLEPFTVFIGPNSAGKSNVMEALGLLSRLTRMPVIEAFKGGRGKVIDQFTRTGSGHVNAMQFAAEFISYEPFPRPEHFQSRYRYELTIELQETSRGLQRLQVRQERFLAMHQDADAWIEKHPEFMHCAGYADAGREFLETRNRQENRTAFRNPVLLNFGLLHIDAINLGRPSEPTDAGELAADASNLPTALAALSDSALGAIRAELVYLVPGIASFDIVSGKDELSIEFELSGGERIPARLVSDGTLRILALLTAMHIEPRPSILGIEEPENGVFPGRLRALLEKLRLASQESPDIPELKERKNRTILDSNELTVNWRAPQILLTTHSSVALSMLLSTPHHLRFVDMIRRNGERVTRARTVGPVKSPQDGRFTITPGEIEGILDMRYEEAAE